MSNLISLTGNRENYLRDPGTGHILAISRKHNFLKYFQYAKELSEYGGIPRSAVEELVERIQVSLLLRMVDPDFHLTPFDIEFTEDYAIELRRWLNAFEKFLSITRSTRYNFI